MTPTCLEVRRALGTDPNDCPEPMLAHVLACPGCSRFAARCAREEQLLRMAVRTPVPEDLGASILMARSFAARARRRVWLTATAACLMAVLGLGAVLGVPVYQEHQLTREVLALVDAAGYALENREPLPAHAVQQALAPTGLSLDAPLEQVSFAGRCLVRGTLAGHLVLRDQQRPVTVFLIPRRDLRDHVKFNDETWSGLLLPSRGSAIAVLAPRGTDMREIAGRVEAAIRWPA